MTNVAKSLARHRAPLLFSIVFCFPLFPGARETKGCRYSFIRLSRLFGISRYAVHALFFSLHFFAFFFFCRFQFLSLYFGSIGVDLRAFLPGCFCLKQKTNLFLSGSTFHLILLVVFRCFLHLFYLFLPLLIISLSLPRSHRG